MQAHLEEHTDHRRLCQKAEHSGLQRTWLLLQMLLMVCLIAAVHLKRPKSSLQHMFRYQRVTEYFIVLQYLAWVCQC